MHERAIEGLCSHQPHHQNGVVAMNQDQDGLLGAALGYIRAFEIENTRPPVVFDLGCGGGEDAVRMAVAGAKVIAIDIKDRGAEVAAKAAQEKVVPCVSFVQMDIRKGLAPIQKKPDIVFSRGAFEALTPLDAQAVLQVLRQKNLNLVTFISGTENAASVA